MAKKHVVKFVDGTYYHESPRSTKTTWKKSQKEATRMTWRKASIIRDMMNMASRGLIAKLGRNAARIVKLVPRGTLRG